MSKTIGEKLYELRKARGLTQMQASVKSGISANTIAAYEKDRVEPSLFKAYWLAELYGVTLDYLVGKSQYKNQEEEAAALERERKRQSREKIVIFQPGEQYQNVT